MPTIQLLLIASNVVTAEVFFLFFVSLTIQNRSGSAAQRAFLAWILSLAATGLTGTVLFSTTSADSALTISKIHYSVLLLGAMILWLFTLLFKRDPKASDMGFLIPGLLAIPLVWTMALGGIEASAFGWSIQPTDWLYVFLTVLFVYYIAADASLFTTWAAIRRAGSPASAKRLLVLAVSVLVLILLGMAIPISSRVMVSGWLTLILNICYIFPPILIAWTFQIENDSKPRRSYSR